MSRSLDERVADVGRWLAAARAVYDDRARLVPLLVRSTGLSPEGVELGFESLERHAQPSDLRALVGSAGNASHVHVILSANVFVTPLRAIALARASSARVTVRPSSRDPTLARALVAAARDPGVDIASGRDEAGDADRIDVYGRDETIARVRAWAQPAVVVRGHGAGLGIAVVTASASVAAAAAALASDVVPFDQRGCLSPRAVVVEGPAERGEAFAEALHDALEVWSSRVPRGALSDAEHADATRWENTLSFAGRVWPGTDHVVAFGGALPIAIPPPGRHVLVTSVASLREVAARIETVARFVVAVGTNEPHERLHFAPPHARVALLGAMQRPPLDGPVDRRLQSEPG